MKNVGQRAPDGEPILNPQVMCLYICNNIKELLCNLQTSEWKNNVLSKPKLRLFK